MSYTYDPVLTKGVESAISKTAIENGKVRFTTDTGRLFLDTANPSPSGTGNVRVEVTDFVKGYSASEIEQILAPLDKFYLASDTFHIYYYDFDNSGWVDVTNQKVNAAVNADTATHATSAVHASSASYSDYATQAGTATHADTADYAINAGTALYSNRSGSAADAQYDASGNEISTYYAPLDSPTFTGTPVSTTPGSSDDSTKIATTAWVRALINSVIGAGIQFDFIVPQSGELPTTGQKGVFYFIPSTNSQTENVYDEFIYVNDAWEQVGSTTFNPTGYYNDYEITGSGNAVTGVSVSNGKITFTKGSTFLTASDNIASATNASSAIYATSASSASQATSATKANVASCAATASTNCVDAARYFFGKNGTTANGYGDFDFGDLE